MVGDTSDVCIFDVHLSALEFSSPTIPDVASSVPFLVISRVVRAMSMCAAATLCRRHLSV
jgi:hypothetical protein